MNVKDALKQNLQFSQHLIGMLLADLTDEELRSRPVPGANTVAWQIGHLAATEPRMAASIPGAQYPDLPEALKAHGKANRDGNPEPAGGYLTKAEYLDWFNRVRAATIAALEQVPDDVLDRPTPPGPMQPLAPTVGALFLLCNNHTMMHAGQFSVARRALGKPVLF